MKRQLEAESTNFQKYEGQEILRGDVVVANVYFESKKRLYRRCDILNEHRKGVWMAYDRKGKREVMVAKEIISEILMDEFYFNRRKKGQKR